MDHKGALFTDDHTYILLENLGNDGPSPMDNDILLGTVVFFLKFEAEPYTARLLTLTQDCRSDTDER